MSRSCDLPHSCGILKKKTIKTYQHTDCLILAYRCVFISQCIHSKLNVYANSQQFFLKILYSFIACFLINGSPHGRSFSLHQHNNNKSSFPKIRVVQFTS